MIFSISGHILNLEIVPGEDDGQDSRTMEEQLVESGSTTRCYGDYSPMPDLLLDSIETTIAAFSLQASEHIPFVTMQLYT